VVRPLLASIELLAALGGELARWVHAEAASVLEGGVVVVVSEVWWFKSFLTIQLCCGAARPAQCTLNVLEVADTRSGCYRGDAKSDPFVSV
jgi:hypothetical protein